jgi:hypothetical protein
MKRVTVRYKVKPDRAARNEEHVRDVRHGFGRGITVAPTKRAPNFVAVARNVERFGRRPL